MGKRSYGFLNKDLLRVSHRILNLKSIKNLKLAKQKSLSRWQLINFGWLILKF
jgi:hypothetical protein